MYGASLGMAVFANAPVGFLDAMAIYSSIPKPGEFIFMQSINKLHPLACIIISLSIWFYKFSFWNYWPIHIHEKS